MPGHRLDSLDIRILRELTQAQTVFPARVGMQASYRTIARAVGASFGTVRNRIRTMSEEGVLRGSSTYPSPRLLGLRAASYAVEVGPPRTKAEVVEQLRGVDGMLFIQNFRGALLGLAFVAPEGAPPDRKLDEIDRIVGGPRGVLGTVAYPPCSVALTETDRALVRRLVTGSFESYRQLSAELRISVRTIKRRLSRLIDSNAILSVPTMDYRAISGNVPADLLVAYSGPVPRSAAARRILERVGEYLIYMGMWSDLELYSLILPRFSLANELADEIARVPGVVHARVELVDEHIDLTRNLRRFLEAPLPVSGAVRRRAAAT